MYEQLKKQLTAKTWNFKSVTAMILFGAIILVFILFGFQGKHNAMGVGSAARVNNALISVAELRSETNRMTQIYGQLFGGQMGGDAQRQFLQQQAMENLIISELTSQAANSQGILATNAEVADMIMHDVPVFQENGRFDKELYLRLLEANHMSPPEFEEKMRKERKTVRARELFQAVSTPDPIEIAKNKALHENKMNVAFAKIDESQLAANVSVSDADIKARLADAEFQKKIEADFSLNKASYGSEEQIHAAHLLLKVAPGDADAEKAALEKMTSIQKRAATEDFGKLAAEFSEDQGSKANNGDLGTFGRGKMVPEFEKAAFSQKVGEVGAPVRTNYGFHLIKVLEHKPAVVPELSAVQEKIAKKLIVQEKVEAALRTVETALSKNDTVALDQALAGLKVKWDETGFVDLTTEGVAKMGSRLASQAIFEVSQQKPLLGHLVQDGNLKFVLKWKAAQKDNVATGSGAFEQMGKERAYEIYGKWTDQIRKSASIEKNPAVLRGE